MGSGRRDVKVDFVRTGGVAGVRLTATLDTEMLSPEEGDRLRRLIAAASFFDLVIPGQPSERGADRFQYRVTVESKERRRTIEIDEASVPEGFQPLLDYLTETARTAQKIKRS